MGRSYGANARGREKRVVLCFQYVSVVHCEQRQQRLDRYRTSLLLLVGGFDMPSGERNKNKTHCINGHIFDNENTRWVVNRHGNQGRICKTCDVERMRRKREKPDFLAREAEKMRRYRERHGESYLSKVREERRKKKEWLDTFKTECTRCGITHPAVLEFHHRDRADKDFLLSIGVAKYSLERLQSEVDKCEIICSNCHRIHHWEERERSKQMNAVENRTTP